MIGIIDYGAGNLFSVENALTHLSIPAEVVHDPKKLASYSGLLLPGVGAYGDAMARLSERGLAEETKRLALAGKPLMGICLGMQLLFEGSEEFGSNAGLALIPGRVVKIQAPGCKIPHMGWNDLAVEHPCALAGEECSGAFVYFVHSFRVDCPDEYVSLSTQYGERIPALVYKDRIFGAQFHPEKSGEIGLSMLARFAALCENKGERA
ncbi:MAG: imidazole glycerol phosphate synthase subunit HisH [Lachnospiraceae bacterium]|nr:imidazole glycerol phosphate synthase subunit HisH [Lachnospiraceae bacterium]